jgi:glutathione S-transferase
MLLDPWHVFTADFGRFPKPYTALATLLDMVLYLIVSFRVGMARRKYKVAAPATDGPEKFLRIFRIQANTLEQLMQHLPLLWIAAFAMDDVFAAALGLVWLFGRCLYAVRYEQKPGRRTKGFMIAMLANLLLLIGAMAGVVASF